MLAAKAVSAEIDPFVLAELCRSRLAGVLRPRISVIVPVFNHWDVTARCLAALLQCDPAIALQVIVVDDASSDDTAQAVACLPGIDIIRNGSNLGFLRSCNRAASIATGTYTLFLNNDTEVTTGALAALVDRISGDDTIGIVGSKLIYPDGRLQEAGGIVFADGSGWNYGRFDAPQKPEYEFCRDVDYVSGASLLVDTKLLRACSGFDERFAPAYYEDVDLCFSVRALGKRVVYEPRSRVVHYEGVSSGTDLASGAKRFQEINKVRFHAKWARVLEEGHLPADAANVVRAARRRRRHTRSIMIVDSYVPLYDREAGSNRLQHLVTGFMENGYHVVFFPDNGMAMEPYTTDLQNRGVEVAYRYHGETRSWKSHFTAALEAVDIVWICRPELCRKYLPTIRANADIPVIYDTIDLHHVRLRRQSEHEGNGDDLGWKNMQELELACATAADATVVVTATEAGILSEFDIETVGVVPTIHNVEAVGTNGYAATSGLIFIGGYNHTPNVDAAKWLAEEIMPLVWEQLPDVRLTLLGSNPPASVQALENERITVPGYVADVAPYFRSSRVFVAPLRYGAGMNGKIGHALAFGVPIVTTPVGASGFALTHGSSAMVVDGARDFAEAVVAVHSDQTLWEKISAKCADRLVPFSSGTAILAALSILNRLLDSQG